MPGPNTPTRLGGFPRLALVAPALAAVAGFIDAVGFVTLHGSSWPT